MAMLNSRRPQDKPKPVPPPPAPAAEPELLDEPAFENVEIKPELLEQTPSEPIETWNNVTVQVETEEEVVPLDESEQMTFTNGHQPAQSPVEGEAEDAWRLDPAIAGSGTQPSWATKVEPAIPLAPEPITTYTGPPGFNTVAAKATAIPVPRTNSRAGRYKNADGQGVVLPPMARGASSMEMQFGSLSFGGEGGDGVEAPPHEPKQPDLPAQPVAPLPQTVTSPLRSTQPPVTTQAPPPLPPAAPVVPVAAAPSAPTSHPYYGHQQQATSQAQPQPSQGYNAQQSLQQQMQQYQAQYLQHQQQQHTPNPSQAQEHQAQQNQYYRSQQDYYNSQPHQQAEVPSQQSQQQSHQASQPPAQATSPYDGGYGGFGGSQSYGQQPQQSHPHQASDAYGGAHRVSLSSRIQAFARFSTPIAFLSSVTFGSSYDRRLTPYQSYDSYAASGYPRPPMEESKPAAPAPSHTPTAQAQPQQGAPQSQYYSQLNSMGGYYQAAPYNPYYQCRSPRLAIDPY